MNQNSSIPERGDNTITDMDSDSPTVSHYTHGIAQNILSSLPFYNSNGNAIKPVNDFAYYSSSLSNSSPPSLLSRIFSVFVGPMKWFFGLRWYFMLSIVVFGAFFYLQIESAIEHRKQARKTKKTTESMQGISSSSKPEKKKAKKHVSFSDKLNGDVWLGIKNTKKQIHYIILQIYNGWIVPWLYMFFKLTSFR